MRSTGTLVGMLVLLVLVSPSNGGHGGTHTWTDPDGGLIGDSNSWDVGLPGLDDTALFNLPNTYTVGFGLLAPTDEENNRLLINDGNVTFAMRTFGGSALYELTSNTDPAISVAGAALGSASLTIDRGQLKGRNALIGTSFNRRGSVTVTNGGFFNVTGTATIGAFTGGSVLVDEGSEFFSSIAMLGTGCEFRGFSCGSGTVTLRDPGSNWRSNALYLGGSNVSSAGQGTINIEFGTDVEVAGTLKMWLGSTINLTGGTLDVRNLDYVDGTLNWTSGSLIIDQPTMVMDEGEFLGSDRALLNTMSLNLGRDLIIGQSGTAMLTVTHEAQAAVGTKISDGSATLGYEGAAEGTLLIDSPFTSWSGSLNVGGHDGGSGGVGSFIAVNGASGSAGYLNVGVGDGATGSAVIAGFSSWDIFRVNVGKAGTGELILDSSSNLSSRHGRIGDEAGSNGTINVDNGAHWQLDATAMDPSFFIIGNDGTGAMNVTNGAVVEHNRYVEAQMGVSEGSAGSATIEGTGSAWTIGEADDDKYKNLTVGFAGNGSLQVLDGGSVRNRAGFIAVDTNSVGSAMVDGQGSSWGLSNLLSVGGLGDGMLTVSDGGDVETTGLFVAPGPGSAGRVTVDSATLRVIVGNVNMPEIVLGGGGEAIVEIKNGGALSGGEAFIGDGSTGVASVEVNGDGSTFAITEDIAVGYFGMGNMTISAGGSATSDLAVMAVMGESEGHVTVGESNALWAINDSLYVGGSAAAAGGTASLTLNTGGTAIVTDTVKIWPGGTVNLNGGVLNAGTIIDENGGAFEFDAGRLIVDTFTGDLTNNGGTLAPGESPGKTHVSGDYGIANALSVLEIELGGTDNSDPTNLQHDVVEVGGNVTLAGILEVELIDDFMPAYGDSFTFMTFDQRNGDFDDFNGVFVSNDMTLAPMAGAADYSLVAALPGDADLNNVVNFDDFVAMSNSYNRMGTHWSQGNFDLNGITNFNDFVILSNFLGTTTLSAAAVPEPGCALLIIFAAVLATRRS